MKNPKLYKQVLDDMRNILKSDAMPLSQKLNELEWRDEFLREFCF